MVVGFRWLGQDRDSQGVLLSVLSLLVVLAILLVYGCCRG